MNERESKLPKGKLSDREVGLLLENLAAGVADQEPLDEIFRALADDLTDTRLQAVAAHFADQLEQSTDIETATASLADVLPTHMRGALAIGLKTGNLPAVLAGLSESELARKRMQRGLRRALAYPLLVFVFLMSVLLLISVFIVPYLSDIYADFELDLPIITVYTLQLAEALPKVIGALGGFALVAFVVSFLFAKSRYVHWLRTVLPLLGRAWMWSGQHEFATLMSTLTRQEVPVPEALACTIESLRDRNLAWATVQVNQRCLDGIPLCQSLRDSIHFDPTLTSLTEWGESNHSLPLALQQAADTYEQQMELFTQFLNRILPPLMLTLVATTMFFLVAALLIPLVGLINGLL